MEHNVSTSFQIVNMHQQKLKDQVIKPRANRDYGQTKRAISVENRQYENLSRTYVRNKDDQKDKYI